MIAAVVGLLGPKVLTALVAVGVAGLAWAGSLLAARHSGTAAARTADVTRELGDRRTADAIGAATAREPDPKAALDREWSR